MSVVDSTTYTSARTIIVNNATSITLNGDVFTSGDTISTLGNYTLVVYGLNGFERIIDFVITHPQLPVTNDSVFTTAKTINLTTATSMTLNGSVFESGTTITRIGYYELIIYGEGGYQSIISFTKTLSTINVANTVYTTSVTPNIQNADLTLNGEIYINQTTISYAGNYQLVISGEGGWIRVIEFTIAPSITGIANGTNYTQSVIPNIPNATLMLNGETYENQTPISYVGNYNLTVYGAGGFEQVVSFTIRPTITGVVDTQSYMGEVYIDTIYDYFL